MKPSKKSQSKSGGSKKNNPDTVRAGILPNGTPLMIDSQVLPKPDGRRCDTCPRRDNLEDNVLRILKSRLPDGESLPDNGLWSRTLRKSADGVWLQWWGYSPRPDGTTQSSTCGVCYHIYNARIKARKITIKEWRQELGNSKELLDGHQALADVCCQKIADKNGCFRSHVDWATADVEALVLVRAMRVKKTKPGFSWQPKWYRSPSPLLVAFFRSSDDSFWASLPKSLWVLLQVSLETPQAILETGPLPAKPVDTMVL